MNFKFYLDYQFLRVSFMHLCSLACIKTINIIFRSQVFEVDQKADPEEEVNITEGIFNSKK